MAKPVQLYNPGAQVPTLGICRAQQERPRERLRNRVETVGNSCKRFRL